MLQAKREQLLPLTGLRFFLAGWVVLLHLHGLSAWYVSRVDGAPGFVGKLNAAGKSAVGMFFLLSGFVLAYSYDTSSAWDATQRNAFWLARFARVYPMYVIGVLLTLGWTLKVHVQHRQLFSMVRMPHHLRAVSAYLLLIQSWIPMDAIAVNGPGWSLSVEAFFYASFPVLGVLLWRLERRWQIFVALTLCWTCMCGVAMLFLPAYRAQIDWMETPILNFSQFNPLVRLPEFMAGILLCRWYLLARGSSVGAHRSLGSALSMGGLLAGVLALCCLPLRSYDLLIHNGVLMPASCALVFGLAMGGGPLAWFLSRGAIVFLGEASFALYLIHVPLYRYVAGIAKVLHIGPDTAIVPLLYLPLALMTAALCHVWVERPARVWILERLGRQSKRRAEQETPATADPM